MAIGSSSTLAEVEAQYDDNASYFENNSVAQAKLFVTAVVMLKRRHTSEKKHENVTIRRTVEVLDDEIRDARDFINNNDSTRSGPRVTRVDLRRFKGGAIDSGDLGTRC